MKFCRADGGRVSVIYDFGDAVSSSEYCPTGADCLSLDLFGTDAMKCQVMYIS